MTMLISGALIMGYAVAATFFIRFWRLTADRLFAMFGAAFFILAVQRLALATTIRTEGSTVWLYALRLLAFLIILAAIADKNRAPQQPG